MRHLLLAKELWKYVDGSEVLAEDASAEARTTFRQKSQKALSTIIMAISTPKLYLVTSCEQPKDVWDTLRKHYERETLANKLFLKKKYFRMEMKEGTSVEAHIKQMKELTDKLASVGAPISEEDQMVTLLGSLPSNYATLVTALEARVDDLSLEFVQQSLIHEEQKQKSDVTIVSQADSALVGAQRKDRARKPPICWNCDEVGHIQRFCPKLRSQYKAKAAEENPASEGMFTVSADLPRMEKWLVDSGASSHMTHQKEFLLDYREFATPEKVGVGDGRVVEALGIGNVRLNMRFKVSESKRATLHNVLYVPKLACNLFSVRAAASKSNTVKFGRTRCWIRSNDGELLGMGSLADKLYQLDCEPATLEHASVVHQQANDVDLWHQRLGHLSGQRLSDMSRKKSVVGLNLSTATKPSFCEGCVEGKMHRAPFKSVGEIRSTRKLQLVHSDVCGLMRTESIGGHKYFVTFIDDYSRCCAVYYLKQKSEVFEKFREFEASATNECGRTIGALRTDNGGEYVSKEFEVYLKSKGIQHELTIAHTPEQNGVAERTNRTLMESARAMLCHAGLPNHYWAEAVGTAAYLKNRVVTSAIKECRTPFERWYERKPDVSHLRVFGCVAYAHVPDCSRQKLDKKADKLRFIGYCTNSKGYRLFDEKTRKLIKSRDVTFNETDFDLRKSEADAGEHTEVVDTDTESGTPEGEAVNEPQEVQEVRRSERER